MRLSLGADTLQLITYNCNTRKLVDIDVSLKKASPFACDRCLWSSKHLFLEFLGTKVASMLDSQSIDILGQRWKSQIAHDVCSVTVT